MILIRQTEAFADWFAGLRDGRAVAAFRRGFAVWPSAIPAMSDLSARASAK